MKDKILEEYKRGNIVISDFDGLSTINMNLFIDQPIDGILYDLNRLEEIILTFIDDPKWINDYALVKVLRKIHEENISLKTKLLDNLK